MHAMMTFVDMARKFGVMTKTAFLCSEIFVLGLAIVYKTALTAIDSLTTPDDGRSVHPAVLVEEKDY